MKTYTKNMQTGNGEALVDELKTCLDLGDKLTAISDKGDPAPGIRKFTFEQDDASN